MQEGDRRSLSQSILKRTSLVALAQLDLLGQLRMTLSSSGPDIAFAAANLSLSQIQKMTLINQVYILSLMVRKYILYMVNLGGGVISDPTNFIADLLVILSRISGEKR